MKLDSSNILCGRVFSVYNLLMTFLVIKCSWQSYTDFVGVLFYPVVVCLNNKLTLSSL